MAAPVKYTVVLRGRSTHSEHIGKNGITPGMLLERFSDAGALKVKAHSTALGKAGSLFATEMSLAGKDLNFAYVDGDTVMAETIEKGGEVYGLVAAGASAIAVGDFLESAGDGTLRKHVVTDSVDPSLVETGFKAVDAVDNSGGGALVRIRAIIL